MSAPSIAGRAEWLKSRSLQRLLAALSENGEEARIAGGAVRNTLLGKPVVDIDIATTVLPEETEKRAAAAGFRPVPTGKEHGTITVVADGVPYEVTTLRDDVETDGRRARVVFGRDWKRDAERRDFTINALYATAEGAVIDLVGGLADIEAGNLRFIGDADARIREDYLRILRFFRFFAWYGTGRPDAEGLRACARLKDGLGQLSAERVWAELKKLLSSPDPSRALLWMRQTGILTLVLPESEKWGIDAIHGLVAAETAQDWQPEALLRLAAIIPPDAGRIEQMAARLKLSKAEASRLLGWAGAPAADATRDLAALARAAYRSDVRGLRDRLRLAIASALEKARQGDDAAEPQVGTYLDQLGFLESWKKPAFPVTGHDLVTLGAPQDARLGKILRGIEDEWIASNFMLERDALVERAAQLVNGQA